MIKKIKFSDKREEEILWIATVIHIEHQYTMSYLWYIDSSRLPTAFED